MENHNEDECRRIKGNFNEERSNNRANRRMRAPEENSSRMESELHSMRRKMDELRNAVKDRATDNLDGII